MSDSRIRIVALLNEYGFAATLEATNVINGNYADKASQARRAKRFLEHLTQRNIKVAAGVAYFSSNSGVAHPREINFHINMLAHVLDSLDGALEFAAESEHLSGDEKQMLEQILRKHGNHELSLPTFFWGGLKAFRECAKFIGVDKRTYSKNMGHIVGEVTEIYVMKLIEEQLRSLQEQTSVEHRYRFSFNGTRSDADVLVFCREGAFYNALEGLQQRDDVAVNIFSRKL